MIGKLKSFFAKNKPINAELPHDDSSNGIAARGSFLNPFGNKRDQAIQSMTVGFQQLTELMGGIKNNLEDNARRQDELLNYLSHLPEVLATIPESSRVHGETLKAIHQQIAHQTIQQDKLGEILNKISETGGDQHAILSQLNERVDQFHDNDRNLAEQLTTLGSAMQTVSRSSGASADVLTQLHSSLQNRDSQLEQVLHKQNTRFTTMLAIAIFMSIAALVAVSVLGYLILTKK